MTSILNFSKYFLLAFSFFLFFSSVVQADTFFPGGTGAPVSPTPPNTSSPVSPTSPNTSSAVSPVPKVSLVSPLKNIGSIEGLLVAILNIIIILMIPIIVFFIILSGFKYVTAQGNASQVEEATRALTYAIIGGVLILGAVAISRIIANVVQSF